MSRFSVWGPEEENPGVGRLHLPFQVGWDLHMAVCFVHSVQSALCTVHWQSATLVLGTRAQFPVSQSQPRTPTAGWLCPDLQARKHFTFLTYQSRKLDGVAPLITGTPLGCKNRQMDVLRSIGNIFSAISRFRRSKRDVKFVINSEFLWSTSLCIFIVIEAFEQVSQKNTSLP